MGEYLQLVESILQESPKKKPRGYTKSESVLNRTLGTIEKLGRKPTDYSVTSEKGLKVYERKGIKVKHDHTNGIVHVTKDGKTTTHNVSTSPNKAHVEIMGHLGIKDVDKPFSQIYGPK